jgi:hypothetical protein
MRFLVVASLLAASAAPASAALVLDQNSFITPVGATLTGSSLTSFALGSGPSAGRWRQQVQSLTVGVAGRLAQVDFQLYRNAMTSTLLEVTVARGSFGDPGYAPVASFTQAVTATQADILAGGFTALDVSSLGLVVAAGDVLSFHLSTTLPASGGSQLFWVIGEPGANPGEVVNAPVLAGGSAQITINGGASWQAVPTDRSLRTHVETASAGVPEPGSWAMLIAGFGLSGTILRRRRARVFE